MLKIIVPVAVADEVGELRKKQGNEANSIPSHKVDLDTLAIFSLSQGADRRINSYIMKPTRNEEITILSSNDSANNLLQVFK